MKRRATTLAWLGWVLLAGVPDGRAQATSAAAGQTVELPPMLVEESTSSVPWLYVNAGGTEFLSRCSASTTRDLVEGWLSKMQLVEALVPAEFLTRADVPAVFVLYAQDLETTVSAEIQRELRAGAEPKSKESRGHDVNIAASMRLTDRDMHASIAYIDEALFDAANMSISPGHVRYMLQARVPELPRWVTDGVERAWRRTDFVMEPITFQPLVWLNQDESDALASDEARPRALLPANELFASEAARSRETRHPRRTETRVGTQELFFRWAMLAGRPMREAFWQLAARAAERPVNEEMFEACFGFDFAELRDRLSDYLPRAVVETRQIDPGKLPDLPRIEVRPATPSEIARVRGEWERLAISHVQRRLPEVREPYIVQARRTLRRAYDAGDRDPRLLATMGLCEIDAGNEAGAREFLEPAVAGGVLRPRAHYELARLRLVELRHRAPEKKSFSFSELALVFQPLQGGLKQSPPMAELYALLGEAWAQCESPPNTAEFAELAAGARLFAQRASVALPIAQALARHGRKTDATLVLDACGESTADEPTRAGFLRLRAELAAAPAGAVDR